MTDATGMLLTAFTRGERSISSFPEKDEKTARTEAMTDERTIPAITRESVKPTAFQNEGRGISERRDFMTLTGEGRKISSPTRAERTAHAAIHTRTAAT